MVETKIEEYLLDHIKGEVTYIFGEKQHDDDQMRLDELKKKIEQIQTKLKRLKDLYILGDFEIDDYIAKKTVLEEELKRYGKELEENKIAVPNQYEKAILIGNPRMIYNALKSNEEKKVFWANLIKRIWIDKDRNITIELR